MLCKPLVTVFDSCALNFILLGFITVSTYLQDPECKKILCHVCSLNNALSVHHSDILGDMC